MSDFAVHRQGVIREIHNATRGESAARCIGEIKKGSDIFGLTKGDFSMVDILRHCAKQIGPCRVDIGTWTAAATDVKAAYVMLNDGNIQSMRWLVDRSFPARQKKYYESVLSKFGRDSVRLARFHAKFILLDNEEFSLAVRTSMNLNLNQRIEFFEISEGSPISRYLREVVDHHFASPAEDSYGVFKDLQLDSLRNDFPIKPARLGGWD